MVYYKENQELTTLKTVTTVRGDIEYRRNTRFIKEKYYTINRDCFQFDDKWYRVDSGNVIYDHELKVFLLKTSRNGSMIHGLVLEEGVITMGFFTPNVYNNVITNSNTYGKVVALNSEILEANGWFEDMGTNTWWDPKDMSPGQVSQRKKIRNEKAFTDRGYNIEDNNDYPKKVDLYNKYPTQISLKAQEMSKYIGDLTFGVEIELQRGCLADNLRNRLGAVICRDGSLNGGAEIVSIPLAGAKGLQTVADLGNALKNRSDISLDCSYHIHFGNLKVDKLSIIALYRLSRCLQNELFTMFPYYKTEPSGLKQKNYTKKLLKLNIGSLRDESKEAYELYIQDSWVKLFAFYSEGKITLEEFDKRTRRHPIERKWERKNRYYYFNFSNLFFGDRHTAEMRLSSGTTNSHKMINWMFICVAMIKYAERNTMKLITSDRTISLKEVLEIYPTMFPQDQKAHFVSKYLYEYFLQRQTRCKKDLEKSDYASEWDMYEDKDYKFSYGGVEGLI